LLLSAKPESTLGLVRSLAGEPRRVRARLNPSNSPMDSIETNRLCDMAALYIFFWAFNITRRN
jgi:hypothetical protein